MARRVITRTRFVRHELKLLLDESDLRVARDFAAQRLTPDTFAGVDSAYELSTLYLDTVDRRIFRRLLDGSGTKYRIRRYGEEDIVYVERKTRRGTLVRKRRAEFPMADLPTLLRGDIQGETWPATFSGAIFDFELIPSLLLTYRRHAWQGPRRSRLTLDDRIEAWHGDGIARLERPGTSASISENVVLELKYDAVMPPEFEELLAMLPIEQQGFSKYTLGIKAAGLAPTPQPEEFPTP